MLIETSKIQHYESNNPKSIFTLKIVAIFFMSIFFGLFLAGGCSTLFINPRNYIAWLYLCRYDKQILYDKNLYDKLEIVDSYKGGEPIKEIGELQTLFATKIRAQTISSEKFLGITRTDYEWYMDNKLVAKGTGYDTSFYRFKFSGDKDAALRYDTQEVEVWCKTKRYFVDKE